LNTPSAGSDLGNKTPTVYPVDIAMALNLMTRKVQGVPAQSARVLCTPRVTVTRRSTIMRYKEDEVSSDACLLNTATGGTSHMYPALTAVDDSYAWFAWACL
jgi:hypothetical protein